MAPQTSVTTQRTPQVQTSGGGNSHVCPLPQPPPDWVAQLPSFHLNSFLKYFPTSMTIGNTSVRQWAALDGTKLDGTR